MAAPLIPMRPKGGRYDLREEEKDGLTWYVLSGCTREDAFLKFIRPDFIGSKASTAIKAAVQQFFAVKDVKDYIENYKKTIEALGSEKKEKPEQGGSLEEKKARAKTKLVEFAMSLAEDIEQASDPEFVLKMADKAGILEQDEKVEEQPRRYLPVKCIQECRYRLFVEENCEDECQFCKYKKFGEENGLHLKPENQLEISGTDIEEKQ